MLSTGFAFMVDSWMMYSVSSPASINVDSSHVEHMAFSLHNVQVHVAITALRMFLEHQSFCFLYGYV